MGTSFAKLSGWLSPKEKLKILMEGLDASGKTTILCKLKSGEVVETIPTIGLEMENIEYNNIELKLLEIGGSCRLKEGLRRFAEPSGATEIKGFIFVVDSSDRDRVDDARNELHSVMNMDGMQDAVLLVLANKQDLTGSMNTTEVMDMLDLPSLKQHHWYVQGSCAISGEGLYEGLGWLCRNIALKGA